LPEVDKFSSVKKKLDSLGSKYGIKKLDKLAAVKSEQHKDIQDNLKLVKSKALSEYVGKIYKRVYSFWKTPLGAVKKSATVSFTIFSKGNISDPIIRKSTGDRNLDSIAVTAVLDSAPFSPIPDALNKTNLKINIVFKYVPKET
jgi:TonB family protein